MRRLGVALVGHLYSSQHRVHCSISLAACVSATTAINSGEPQVGVKEEGVPERAT